MSKPFWITIGVLIVVISAVLDEDGKLLDEIRFSNDLESIEEFAGKLTTFETR